MRREILINDGWTFIYRDGSESIVNIPHTWNAKDGQDGGNDYYRGKCTYKKQVVLPAHYSDDRIYLQFNGVNIIADVRVNGLNAVHHVGGYEIFRADITDLVIPGENLIEVDVDNSVNDFAYPQKADFTFYGGIHRDVKILIVDRDHFSLDYWGSNGISVTPVVKGKDAEVKVQVWADVEGGKYDYDVRDKDGNQVFSLQTEDKEIEFTLEDVHLWRGIKDPYLYSCKVSLLKDGLVKDEVSTRFGVRTIKVDPKKGFFLNGESYPLRGVARHQDWKDIGNALTKENHDIDMQMIKEIGANTVRCSHYQHDQYFYDLCDENGIVVWAEIPYISEHMPKGRECTLSMMKELIIQNYNHPSICVWGISNEITISTKDKKDMLSNHHQLNDLCHELDKTRPTALACYAMCGFFNKSAHITDLVSWNLYLGWYVPGFFLNDVWISLFHTFYPKRCLGYSEYGCEGMPNLHTSHPKRGDQSEEYQAKYHEFMLRCFERHPYMWATHVWNMFDFAADARNQGGEPGMNHKGLVTFDRQIKKDSFYLYKAYWSKEKFVHICSKRYVDRNEKKTKVRVYSNAEQVTLYVDDKRIETVKGDKIFEFKVKLGKETKVRVEAGELHDEAVFRYVEKKNPDYILKKGSGSGQNWATKKEEPELANEK